MQFKNIFSYLSGNTFNLLKKNMHKRLENIYAPKNVLHKVSKLKIFIHFNLSSE